MANHAGAFGSCHCRAVRFEIEFPTDFCSHCHCVDCRRSHGSALVTWTSVPLSRFRYLAGEERLRRYESHPGVTWIFCEDCGTSLLYLAADAPDRIYLTVANLEGALDRAPDGHVSFEEHVSWLPFADGLPRYVAKSEEPFRGEAFDAPMLEANVSRAALIEPSQVHKPRDIPPLAVVCFFHEVIAQLVAKGVLRKVAALRSEIGENPVYEVEFHGRKLSVFHPGVGCPLAAGFLENAIAFGARSFVACGGAGVLDSGMVVGSIVIPSSAVRDEGTSFHYLPPSREVSTPVEFLAPLESVLRRHGVPYQIGKTWTTDGFYRETAERIARRRAEGCLTVDMETAAFFAVARFRGVPFGQYLYGGDDVSGAAWDSRDWDRQASVREKLFWLAVEASLELGATAGETP